MFNFNSKILKNEEVAAGVLMMDEPNGRKLNIHRIIQQSRNSHQFCKGNCRILAFNLKAQEGISVIKRCVQREEWAQY